MRVTILIIWSSILAIIPSPAHAQASFFFSNYNRFVGLDAPITDASGIRLEGTNYVVMLYGGISSNSLVALPPASPFMTGGLAGYFSDRANPNREIPDIAGGANVWVQLKAWDMRLGKSYEEARSRNIGGYGESDLMYLQSGGCHQCLPEFLHGLKSFALRPYSGTFILISNSGTNKATLQWIGDAARVQIQEKSVLNDPWENVGNVVTNSLQVMATNRMRFFRILNSP